jgi:hypothetical protein
MLLQHNTSTQIILTLLLMLTFVLLFMQKYQRIMNKKIYNLLEQWFYSNRFSFNHKMNCCFQRWCFTYKWKKIINIHFFLDFFLQNKHNFCIKIKTKFSLQFYLSNRYEDTCISAFTKDSKSRWPHARFSMLLLLLLLKRNNPTYLFNILSVLNWLPIKILDKQQGNLNAFLFLLLHTKNTKRRKMKNIKIAVKPSQTSSRVSCFISVLHCCLCCCCCC